MFKALKLQNLPTTDDVKQEEYDVGDTIELENGRRGRYAGSFYVELIQWDDGEEGAIFAGNEDKIRMGLPIAINTIMEIDRKNWEYLRADVKQISAMLELALCDDF